MTRFFAKDLPKGDDERPVEHMTEKERHLAEFFVREYLVDYNRVDAAIRIGFPGGMAPMMAERFMEMPYVKRLISDATMKVVDAESADAETDKQKIRAALMKEAHYRGPGSSHAARVSALGILAKIHRMDVGTGASEGQSSGVMEIPSIAGEDDWQKVASAQQEKLAHESIVH